MSPSNKQELPRTLRSIYQIVLKPLGGVTTASMARAAYDLSVLLDMPLDHITFVHNDKHYETRLEIKELEAK